MIIAEPVAHLRLSAIPGRAGLLSAVIEAPTKEGAENYARQVAANWPNMMAEPEAIFCAGVWMCSVLSGKRDDLDALPRTS